MRRRVAVLAAVVVMTAATACIPELPPPPAYQPPVITGISVSPQPAHPGDVVTIVLDVADDEVISDVDVPNAYVPDGPGLNTIMQLCTDSIAPTGTAGNATVTLTCALPSYASNGTWKVDVRVFDRATPNYAYTGTRAQIPFEVTGGADDRSAPSLLDYSTDPAAPSHTAPFTLTFRLEDQAGARVSASPIFKMLLNGDRYVNCGSPAYTQVDATTVQVVMTCTPGWAEPGIYRGPVPVVDGLNHQGSVEMFVTLT